MDFKDEMLELENAYFEDDFIIKKGSVPILFSAPHTMMQEHDDGTYKLSEPFTKALALYLNKHFNVYSIVKINDTGMDSNRDNRDDYKKELLRLVRDNDIKVVIDLHGASIDREFDIEFGTLNNLSADFSIINEFKEAFFENGITNISFNDPFRGGAIIQYLYGIEDVDVIQLEINRKYRDENNIELMYKLTESISNFIYQYIKYTNR